MRYLRTVAFTKPLELIRLTERAAEIGLRTAEDINTVLVRGYEERWDDEAKEWLQEPISRDRRAQLRLALDSCKILISVHTEKERSNAIRDVTAFNSPHLVEVMAKVHILAPDLSKKGARRPRSASQRYDLEERGRQRRQRDN